ADENRLTLGHRRQYRTALCSRPQGGVDGVAAHRHGARRDELIQKALLAAAVAVLLTDPAARRLQQTSEQRPSLASSTGPPKVPEAASRWCASSFLVER